MPCFFSKVGGRVAYGNDAYKQDAGNANVKDLRERDLYEENLAIVYENDDKVAHEKGQLDREEWHQPKGKPCRRVFVHKEKAPGSTDEKLAIRGLFYDVHEDYLREYYVNRLACDFLPRTEGMNNRAHRQSCQQILQHSLRLLNLRSYELRNLTGKPLQDLHRFNDIHWTPEIVSLKDVLDPVEALLQAAFGAVVNFKFEYGRLKGDDQVNVDVRHVQAAALGLCLFAADGFPKPLAGPLEVKFYTTAEKGDATHAGLLDIEVSYPNHDLAPANLTAEERAQWMASPSDDPGVGMGLELACRVARLASRHVSRSTCPVNGTPQWKVTLPGIIPSVNSGSSTSRLV